MSLREFLIVLACAAVAGIVDAASLRVAPLQVNLAPERETQQLELLNQGNSDVVVDVHVMAWSQESGQDQLEPTDRLVAVPPVVRIPAGKKQVLRVGLANPRDSFGPDEGSYRLVMTEVPQASGEEGTLRFQLRVLIPVFVQPAVQPRQEISLSLRKDGEQLLLDASNNGNVHAKIASLVLLDKAQRVISRENLTGYVLPGATRSIRLGQVVTEAAIEAGEAEIFFGDASRPVKWSVMGP